MKERNGAVEFYRFLFACIIFFLHIRNYAVWDSPNGAFNGGYLGVEFFFILGGFLLAGRVEREETEVAPARFRATASRCDPAVRSVKYFAARFARIMPQYWFSMAVLLLIKKVMSESFSIKSALLKGFPEIIGCQIFWRPDGGINGQLWYISGMLWASALLYYLLCTRKAFTLCILTPFGLMTFLGYVFQTVGHIDITRPGTPELFLAPFFRAFFETALGCALYFLFLRLRKHPWNLALCSGMEILLSIGVVAVMWRTRRDYKDFIMVFVIGAFVLVMMLGQGILSRLLDNRFSQLLGEISFPLYLNQYTFQWIAKEKFPGLPYWRTALAALVADILFSAVASAVFRRIPPISGRKRAA